MNKQQIIDDIEHKIACHEITAAQAFTQMKQILALDSWIPVDERLPNRFDDVLIACEGVIFIGLWLKQNQFWIGKDGRRLKSVTHWKPLPEPLTKKE